VSIETSRGPRVAVVGTGYVGTVVAACFSLIGRTVVGVEIDPAKLEQLRSGTAPFYEPGLDELLREQVASGRLTFTDDMGMALDGAEVVFLAVGTPTGKDGHPDMSFVAAAAKALGPHIRDGMALVTKSTVPIGSGAWLGSIIEESHETTVDFAVVSNPEFLREGTAIDDFLHPDRVVIGSKSREAIELVTEAYRPILDQTFRGGRPDTVRPNLVTTGLATAETIKYAANAFLATKISYINEISQICEKVGADVTEVAHAIGLDQRIGDKFLNAGVGWGGSCFGKDLDALAAIARDYGLSPEMLDAVREVNRRQRLHVVDKLQLHLKTLRGRRIALFGLAFKPGTDDLRDAPSIDIARRLVELGATVLGYDPIVKEVPGFPELRTTSDAFEAAERADAVVVVTEWPEFDEIDLERLAEVMRGDLFFDGRNAIDSTRVRAAGLRYEGIGRGEIFYTSPAFQTIPE
jgi:UDPglucose 6-dehydrogenase